MFQKLFLKQFLYLKLLKDSLEPKGQILLIVNEQKGKGLAKLVYQEKKSKQRNKNTKMLVKLKTLESDFTKGNSKMKLYFYQIKFKM
ncbi:unnamed protein product [Paramecium octaurelia]|uniref:Uncharacterized protein n=1 Tax=Paramecium octaurelia TaxID=43137 RepID=A0A8S1UMP9_PAROT|nr:unnamed protein product [Paramecium octaurelia]